MGKNLISINLKVLRALQAEHNPQGYQASEHPAAQGSGQARRFRVRQENRLRERPHDKCGRHSLVYGAAAAPPAALHLEVRHLVDRNDPLRAALPEAPH